ncbi:hypothetical protein [Gaoshiqia sp. Z1-71]|uniref:hypothetical protein n=1 Tax=Gaoshiqia hydrogeniformans TaxID=3290090 RepID=UPI003BF833B2
MAVTILTACDGLFIPDPIDPRLPKYTEDGNNVAGAFINDDVWESIVLVGFFDIHNAPFINAKPANDSLVVQFQGNVAGQSSTIEFHLGGISINQFEDLLHLHDTKIQLDGITNAAYYIEDYHSMTYENKGIGQIYFKNVSRTNNSASVIILSGTFGFSVIEPGGMQRTVSYGRFDYRISESSNFLID